METGGTASRLSSTFDTPASTQPISVRNHFFNVPFLQGESSCLRLTQGRLRCEWTGSSELDLHLSPFLYTAIDWRLVTSVWWKAGERTIRGFLVDFGVTVRHCFSFWSVKSLGFGRPTDAVDSSLEAPWSYADARVCSRAETGVVFEGVLKFCLGVRSPLYPAPG
jgi:hypothetical protein